MLVESVGVIALTGAALAGYSTLIEPFRLRVKHHQITPGNWPRGFRLRLAVIADIHACEPWMNAERISQIVKKTNALQPDLVALLGDYVVAHRWITGHVPPQEWAAVLAGLTAPCGVHAVLGNHDWWDDHTAQERGGGPLINREALEAVGIPVYENDVRQLAKDGQQFWIAGLGDQVALYRGRQGGRRRFEGLDDLPGTIAKADDDSPMILLAHEPDIFPDVPSRVSLTLAGHTHGGQVRLLGYAPVVPSRFGNRYAYGHIVESRGNEPNSRRHMVVSGGLGCSILPIRFGIPPEIVIIDLVG